MDSIQYSAPGKVHFLGEHAVVYGKPAILASVGLRCFVKLERLDSEQIEVFSKDYNLKQTLTLSELLKKTQKAKICWEKYIRTGDVNLLSEITSEKLDYIFLCVGETLNFWSRRPSSGFRVLVSSEIPEGSGLGSSAALAVSVAAVMSEFLGEKFDNQIISEIAFNIEKRKHGMPSGADPATSANGGFIWFQKKSSQDIAIEQVITDADRFVDKFLLINTGAPQESTGEMVAQVKKLYDKNPEFVKRIFSDQEQLVVQLRGVIERFDHVKIIEIIRQGEANLDALGVVSDSSRKIILSVESIDGVAKICGGGGVVGATGILLATSPHIKDLTKLLKKNKIPFFNVKIGVEGLRKEN
ncbi:MAG TPA: mevalonate kinase [Patescibacteria group bacterium]|nr:mevalonate kinase [Patescibacteria group bacterium]